MRRLVLLLGLCWLGLTAVLAGKSMFVDDLREEGPGDSDVVSAAGLFGNGLETAGNGLVAAPPVRSAVDLGMDALSAERRVEVVEDALLNGNLVREQARDAGAVETVAFWREATPYNVRVTFRPSDFRRAAPGVEGPFCGQRVNYDLSLVDGNVSWSRTESEAHPVPFLLPCARADLSRNAGVFEERSARAFLPGTWGMSFVCGGEKYELRVKFLPTTHYAPSTLGNVEGLIIDRIEEPQWTGQMDARRDRESGQLDIKWSEDDRGLHRSGRAYTFRAAAPDEAAGLMRGEVLVREGEVDGPSCGSWSAKKFPAPVR